MDTLVNYKNRITENTLENKSRFIAQHYGQDILLYNNAVRKTQIISHGIFTENKHIDRSILLLTPLSQISDEDATNIYKIILGQNCTESVENIIFYGKAFCREYDTDNEFLEFSQTYWEIRNTIDYLRSRGYALPWMGLSVETLVEYGWVKLKVKKQ